MPLAAGASLMLCARPGAFWARSFLVSDWFICNSQRQSFFIETGGGQFRFQHARNVDPEWASVRRPGFEHRADKADGPLEEGTRMPGSRQHFRKWGFWLVTGERWGDEHHAFSCRLGSSSASSSCFRWRGCDGRHVTG